MYEYLEASDGSVIAIYRLHRREAGICPAWPDKCPLCNDSLIKSYTRAARQMGSHLAYARYMQNR